MTEPNSSVLIMAHQLLLEYSVRDDSVLNNVKSL